jgi:hypothetical protein
VEVVEVTLALAVKQVVLVQSEALVVVVFKDRLQVV